YEGPFSNLAGESTMMRTTRCAFLMTAALAFAACDDSDPTGIEPPPPPPGDAAAVIDSDITSNRTLYADTVYTLKGFIKVPAGVTLTIQPGTVIQGDYETLGSSLFVLRGGRIMACGTAEAPIVFTSSQRSEEHTSELQSRENLVCRLLLE